MKFSIRSIRLRRSKLRGNVIDMGHELARQGRWIALINQETGQGRRVRLYVAWRPLALIVMALMVAGYVAAAAALTFWLDRRPHNQVTFADVVLPWRWSGVQDLRAKGFAEQGMIELEAGNISRAIFFLQRGLGLNPDHPEARLKLARFYADANYYESVRRMVPPQFAFGFHRELAELLLSQAQRANDLELILEFAAEQRPRLAVGSDDAFWLIGRWADALAELERPDEAADLLVELDSTRPEIRGSLVQALIAAERLDEAWAVAESVAPALPGMDPLGLRLQAMVLGARPEQGELLEVLTEIRDRSPQVRQPWIFGIEGLAAAEMTTEAERWIGDYLSRFAAQPGAVEQMLQRVSITGNVEIIRYAYRRSSEWKKMELNYQASLALVLINEGEWAAIDEDLSELMTADGAANPLAAWVQAMLDALRPDNPPHLLEAALGRTMPGLMLCRAMAAGFAASDRWDLVKLVTDTGLRAHRHSVALHAFADQAQSELERVVAADRAGEMIEARSFEFTERDVPRVRFELRRAVENENWDLAESMIREIRRNRPAWMSEVQKSLDYAEAHVAAARRDFDRLVILAPAVLTRDPDLSAWFTDQAELAVDQGAGSVAIRLLRIVLEKDKFFHRARARLKELTEIPEPAADESGDGSIELTG